MKKDEGVLYMKGVMRMERRRAELKILLKQFKVRTWVKKDKVVLYMKGVVR